MTVWFAEELVAASYFPFETQEAREVSPGVEFHPDSRPTLFGVDEEQYNKQNF